VNKEGRESLLANHLEGLSCATVW